MSAITAKIQVAAFEQYFSEKLNLRKMRTKQRLIFLNNSNFANYNFSPTTLPNFVVKMKKMYANYSRKSMRNFVYDNLTTSSKTEMTFDKLRNHVVLRWNAFEQKEDVVSPIVFHTFELFLLYLCPYFV